MDSDTKEEGMDVVTPVSAPSYRPKQRIRVCDHCRRKKIRCDGEIGRRCSTCPKGMECTYGNEPSRPVPRKRDVENLENRVKKAERILQRYLPPNDFIREFGGTFDRENRSFDGVLQPQQYSSYHLFNSVSAKDYATLAIRQNSEDPAPKAYDMLSELDDAEPDEYFGYPAGLGKSSVLRLLHDAQEACRELLGVELRQTHRREYLWKPLPWEDRERFFASIEVPLTFPPDDLLFSLVDLYFTSSNFLLPLLHRPSFERDIHQGRHLNDYMFGSLVLLVCGIGSKYTNDPRVLLDEERHSTDTRHSAGMPWFTQFQIDANFLREPTLENIQAYCLAVLFLHGTSNAHATYPIISICIRMAQEAGAHRRWARGPGGNPTVVEELWKRAWWLIVQLETLLCSQLGKTSGVQIEAFDTELPVECDDEYWENPDPSLAFVQPPDKPSNAEYYICVIKLSRIMNLALYSLYSTENAQKLYGFGGPKWNEHIVSELDSATNKWLSSIPEHLRWDPDRVEESTYKLSAFLYTFYYMVQILIHRPFITSPIKHSFPSATICMNAARSCCRLLDLKHMDLIEKYPYFINIMFTSSMIILLHCWAEGGPDHVPSADQARVLKTMSLLDRWADRWPLAGRYCDILSTLISTGEIPTEPLTAIRHKGTRQAAPPPPPPTLSTATASSYSSSTTSPITPVSASGPASHSQVQSLYYPYGSTDHHISSTFYPSPMLPFNSAARSYFLPPPHPPPLSYTSESGDFAESESSTTHILPSHSNDPYDPQYSSSLRYWNGS